MAFRPMTSKDTGNSVTAADWQQIGDNFTAGVPDVMTTKGDLIVGTGIDTAARLGIGNNGELLIADSSKTTGIQWNDLAHARLKDTGTQSYVASLTWTPCDKLTDEDFDTAAAASSYVFTAVSPGYYLVGASFRIIPDSHNQTENGLELVAIYKNDANYAVLGCTVVQDATTQCTFYNSGMTIVQLNTGDHIEPYCYHDTGATEKQGSDAVFDHWFVSILA